MKTGPHLQVAPQGAPTPVVPRKRRVRRRSSPVVAKVLVLNPVALGRLRSAVALGADLEVSFDGYGLIVKAVLA